MACNKPLEKKHTTVSQKQSHKFHLKLIFLLEND